MSLSAPGPAIVSVVPITSLARRQEDRAPAPREQNTIGIGAGDRVCPAQSHRAQRPRTAVVGAGDGEGKRCWQRRCRLKRVPYCLPGNRNMTDLLEIECGDTVERTLLRGEGPDQRTDGRCADRHQVVVAPVALVAPLHPLQIEDRVDLRIRRAPRASRWGRH